MQCRKSKRKRVTMSQQQRKKDDQYLFVQYHEDWKLQVRRRRLIKSKEHEPILILYGEVKEGWHRRMNQKASKSNLQFYVMEPLLLREAKLITINEQLVSQEAVVRNRRATYIDMDAKIFKLWDHYDTHDIVTEEFLGEIYGRASLR